MVIQQTIKDTGDVMYIVVYETVSGKSGGAEERPLALFRNPFEAKVFLSMVRKNGRAVHYRMI